MKIRLRELTNDEWIAEVRSLLGWKVIAADYPTNGDMQQRHDNSNKRMTAMRDYAYALRYRDAAKKTRIEAWKWAEEYAASRGLSYSDITKVLS